MCVFSRALWNERCETQFERRRSQKPIGKTVEDSYKTSRELELTATSKNQRELAEKTTMYLEAVKNLLEKRDNLTQFDRWRRGETNVEMSADGNENSRSSSECNLNTNERSDSDEEIDNEASTSVELLRQNLDELGFV
ncbi:hypothetical protein R1flu_001543 [Riccia fluitans]|uniref:Uncharacterized protein n=1 Tax=Riccia fluitans TaxID=41844 RepID=A0ABD1Y3K3_9MARC